MVTKLRDPVCMFLGDPTGELRKKSCKTVPSIIEYWCTHVARQHLFPRNSRREEEKLIKGRCTEVMNHEFRSGLPVQPCHICKLYQPLQ